VTDRHDGRVGFGSRLRRLREDAGLSGKLLAERLGWPASKVSRLENGRQTATVVDVEAWASALDLPAPVRAGLIEDLRSLRVEYATWRRQMRGGFAPRQRAGRALLEGTTTLRAFQPALVPGLLQTAEYARAVYRGVSEFDGGPQDIEAAVRERLRRQELLYEPGRQLRFLLTEAALRSRPAPVGVHRAQLDRLLVLAGVDTVELAVLPWAVELPRAMAHSFDVYDDQLVLVETVTAELGVRDSDDVALYIKLFELYWGIAARGEQASALITRIAMELPG
jgi:transcriptional regulator with XRE-family HTH domain